MRITEVAVTEIRVIAMVVRAGMLVQTPVRGAHIISLSIRKKIIVTDPIIGLKYPRYLSE